MEKILIRIEYGIRISKFKMVDPKTKGLIQPYFYSNNENQKYYL